MIQWPLIVAVHQRGGIHRSLKRMYRLCGRYLLRLIRQMCGLQMAVKKDLPATIMHMHACKSIRIIRVNYRVRDKFRITISMGNTDRGTRSFITEGKHADRMIIVAKGLTHPGGVIDVWWRPEIIGLLMSAPFSDVLLSNLLFSSWSCSIIAYKSVRL